MFISVQDRPPLVTRWFLSLTRCCTRVFIVPRTIILFCGETLSSCFRIRVYLPLSKLSFSRISKSTVQMRERKRRSSVRALILSLVKDTPRNRLVDPRWNWMTNFLSVLTNLMLKQKFQDFATLFPSTLSYYLGKTHESQKYDLKNNNSSI